MTDAELEQAYKNQAWLLWGPLLDTVLVQIVSLNATCRIREQRSSHCLVRWEGYEYNAIRHRLSLATAQDMLKYD